jgi:hypothetical protein
VSARDLPSRWRLQADQLERFAPAAATAFRDAAAELEAALRAEADELLSLSEAAELSGYSVDHLRHLVADGAIPQAGRRGKPKVRRGDLPKRAGKCASSTYDPAADAMSLVGRRKPA